MKALRCPFLLGLLVLANLQPTSAGNATPPLRITRAPNPPPDLLLAWPRTAGDCVLETNDSLDPSAWKLSLETPQLGGDDFWVGISYSGGQGFFRLRALPQNPAGIAPPVPGSTVTGFTEATAFLYSGTNAVQLGVTNGTIAAQRAAVVRGRVSQRDGSSLSAVRISVLHHPELGYTYTRVDGRFDLAVNGGGSLTVSYERDGFLPAQRQVTVPWQDYVEAAEVVMVQADPAVTLVTLGTTAPLQVARGTVQTDADGARQATLILPPGTAATLVLPDGATRKVHSLNLRATEYTVGPNGPKAMPAELPPNSAYTYCVALNADEALAAGAASVQFDRPLWFYVDNFLNFPVGGNVPTGYYDRQQGKWIASDNGQVIQILTLNDGLAELDVTGTGVAADAPTLAALGVTDAERARLATLYAAGKSLWRVPVQHFSDWDCNWGWGPPPDARAPNPPPPVSDPVPDQTCKAPGSEIGLQRQTLGEDQPVVGTPYSLHYQSDRVAGYVAANALNIQLTDASTPSSAFETELKVEVAGRLFEYTFPISVSSYRFVWDGKDAYGRLLQGQQPVSVRIGYTYHGVYVFTGRFGYNGNGTRISGAPTRMTVTLWKTFRLYLGPFDARGLGLGGWMLSAHHSYDPAGRILRLGSGEQRTATTVNAVIRTVAGNGLPCGLDCSEFIGPASQARLNSPRSVAVGPDGSLYILDESNGRGAIWCVRPDGTISHFAGAGQDGGSGADGIPATEADLYTAHSMAVGADGSVYLTLPISGKIRRITPDGLIWTIAGNGSLGFSADGSVAALSSLTTGVGAVAVTADGSVHFIEDSRVRRIGPDGLIYTVAGNGQPCWNWYPCDPDGPALGRALVPDPKGLAVDHAGNVYFLTGCGYLCRVSPDGLLRTVAGLCEGWNAGEHFLTLGSDGLLYVTFNIDHHPSVLRVSPDGSFVQTIAGGNPAGYAGDNGPATAASFGGPSERFGGLAFTPDGTLYIGDRGNDRVRSVSPPLPGFGYEDILIPSEDGRIVYHFDVRGRHLRTLQGLTGTPLLTFGYETNGSLASLTDGDGNLTTVERDAGGNPTGIVGPYGQRTAFTLDANGYLASISNPAAERSDFVYNADGLLTSMTDPNGGRFTFSYDEEGRLTRDADPLGGFTALARTNVPNGFLVTVSNALGRTSTHEADRFLDTTRRQINTFPDGLKSQLRVGTDQSYASQFADGRTNYLLPGPDPRWGMLAPLTEVSSTRTPGGLALTESETHSAVLTNADDLFSLQSLVAIVSRNGINSTSTYSAATLTLTDLSPQGRPTISRMDTQGRLAGIQVGELAPTAYSYDDHGRVQMSVEGLGPDARTNTFAYGADGNLASFTDALGRTTSLSYDLAGRVVGKALPGGRLLSLGYDTNGNLTSVAPPGRPAHRFSYTSLNQTAAYIPPDVGPGSNRTSYAYNAARELVRVVRPDGRAIDRDYEGGGCNCGRLNAVTISRGTLNYHYDPVTGNLASLADPGGITLSHAYDGNLLTNVTWTGSVTGSVAFSYDNLFRLASVGVNGAHTIAYQKDDDDLLVKAGDLELGRDPQNGLLTGTSLGVVRDAWTYDQFGDAITYAVETNGAPLLRHEFQRDRLGRVVRKTEIILGVTNVFDYAYDEAGRLTNVLAALNSKEVSSTSYAYDLNGNRLSRFGADGTTIGLCDDQDRLLQYGATAFDYTLNGEMRSRTAGGQTTSYQYDELGNLMEVGLPDGTAITYLVDASGRRVAKRVNGVVANAFLYQSQFAPVAELDGDNQLVSLFVYATRLNVPDYLVKGGATYRVITDHLGSPRLVVDATTGAVVQRLDYDEFGRVLLDTNPGFQPFGFAGGLYDPDTGLVRFVARDYDAEAGRWTAKDPLGFAAGLHDPDTQLLGFGARACHSKLSRGSSQGASGLEPDSYNFYTYAGDDPVNFADLDGRSVVKIRQWWDLYGKIVDVYTKWKECRERTRKAQRLAEEYDKALQCGNTVQQFQLKQDLDKAWYEAAVACQNGGKSLSQAVGGSP